MKPIYSQPIPEVLEELHTTEQGLTAAEAAKRLDRYGPNRLQGAEKPTLLQRFAAQLKDPMLLILLAAAAVSGITNYLSGESFAEAIIMNTCSGDRPWT